MKRSFSQYLSNIIGSVNNIANITDEHSQVLEWISPVESHKRHREASVARLGGVGDWVLETPEFQSWRGDENGRSHEKVLLCCGIPGAGKTFTCSLIIDALCDNTTVPNVGVAYLYCDYRKQEEHTSVKMIGSLLRQFVAAMPEVLEELTKAFRIARGQLGGRTLQLERMMDMFPKVLASFDRTFICVDALDEFPVEHRANFLQLLGQIIDKSPNTRLFLSGRPFIQLELDNQFGRLASTINIQLRHDDVRRYLTQKLNDDPVTRAMDDELRAEIMENMMKKDTDIFLLLALHIDAILREVTISERRKKLHHIGNSLNNAYGPTIDRIRSQSEVMSRLGMAALMWTSLAERPLSITELCYALAVKIGTTELDPDNIPSIQTVLACCLGLVAVDEETSTVRLIHTTLQEQLQSQQDIFGSPHSTIAEVCLTYLNFQYVQQHSAPLKTSPGRFSLLDGVLARFPFIRSGSPTLPLLEYASGYWIVHAQRGLTESAERSTIDVPN
ncbi:hypothetical protein L873DRAFT_1752079 [Choiromyces venosus 120613-1]|uniref:Uncharacterized protein n=1 Tax=Choiromyces venosus 120613-1 TaxID=1336337 RepID=A0A3N4J336_9PEZI|nr:hypothetical protein L873DRAFT_1752079 [Choiromyces venosus 120613-1]